ncbi:MAG: hypothetical protein OYH77_06250 [Pseudomonadota bacterium]|nr:hypothetical protein [Pseudomonadota bacterium]
MNAFTKQCHQALVAIALLATLATCSGGDEANKVKNEISASYQGLFKNQAIVLDAKALTQLYQRFFTISDADVFTAAEKKSLGVISYDNVDPLLQRGFHLRDTDQAYIKTLRVKLLELCTALVASELGKVRSDPSADSKFHHLVFHDDVPTVAHVTHSMRLMFNMPAALTHIDGANEYTELFARNVNAASDRAQALNDNYVLLCMAIGQDARAYLR